MEANQTTIRAALLRSGEALRVALDAIISHRLRSALTVGGVVVGVAVVVLVAALLNGLQLSIKELTAAFAPEVIRVEKASFQDFAGDGQAFVEAESKDLICCLTICDSSANDGMQASKSERRPMLHCQSAARPRHSPGCVSRGQLQTSPR